MSDEDLSGVRVVIVGADRECLQVAGLSLEMKGAAVRCATSRERGLAEVGAFEPHVVVCDLSSADDQFNLVPHLAGHSRAVALTRFSEGHPRGVPVGFDVCVDRARDIDLLASMVAGVVARHGLNVQAAAPADAAESTPPDRKD
jgi:CheY-like chemotaxis protein